MALLIQELLNQNEISVLKDFILEVIKRRHDETGNVPTVTNFNDLSLIIFRLFGSWNNALIEAGLTPNFSKTSRLSEFNNYEDDYVLNLLSLKTLEIGNCTYDYFKAHRGDFPSPQYFVRRFNIGWGELMERVKKLR
jgi:hypothetical protein